MKRLNQKAAMTETSTFTQILSFNLSQFLRPFDKVQDFQQQHAPEVRTVSRI